MVLCSYMAIALYNHALNPPRQEPMSNLKLARRIGLWGALALGAFTVIGSGYVDSVSMVLFFLLGALMYGSILFVIVLGLLSLFRRGNRADKETAD